jgi:acrylyl-CoA reductase (NADPH)
MVRMSDEGNVRAAVEQIAVDDLPDGPVLIRVAYSSLNYKDALAATGHRGVVKRLPHVPGIDAAGTVAASTSSRFQPGDEVLVTGYEQGAGHWGGYAAYVRVPADWVVPLPRGLTLAESMIYGTAGFTAAQALGALSQGHVDPGDGEVVVTGASGGVGSFAVALLAKAGYIVVAVTGKPSARAYLKRLGASRVLPREEVSDVSGRPLLSARWSAAVDTVGGDCLSTLLRSTKYRGCVAACGLVGGVEVPITVYPFILRGISLVGIDAAQCPMQQRLAIWSRLAGQWKLDHPAEMVKTINLGGLDEQIKTILAGKITGRVLVRPTVD